MSLVRSSLSFANGHAHNQPLLLNHSPAPLFIPFTLWGLQLLSISMHIRIWSFSSFFFFLFLIGTERIIFLLKVAIRGEHGSFPRSSHLQIPSTCCASPAPLHKDTSEQGNEPGCCLTVGMLLQLFSGSLGC